MKNIAGMQLWAGIWGYFQICEMKQFGKFLFAVVTISLLWAIKSPYAAAISVSQYANFTNNINQGYANNHLGRYFLDDQQVTVTGDIPGSGAREVAIIVGTVLITHYGEKALNALDNWISGLFDPQDAFLFTDFSVGGVSIFQDLVSYSTAPQNRIYEAYLPDFLGGTTFIASTAFSGMTFDQAGNPITSGVDVGFGVFRTDSGTDYFAPINFAATPNDLARIESMLWELSPITDPLVGQTFRATGLHLQVSEHPLPEPSTFALLAWVGIAFLQRQRGRNGKRLTVPFWAWRPFQRSKGR